MPKTLPERIFFTIVMAAIMVYGMIVYNVALATGGVTNATFVMALHEMPIMVPVAFVLEFFVVEKLATKLADWRLCSCGPQIVRSSSPMPSR